MLPGDTWSSSLVRMYLLFGVASAISETLLAFSSRGFNPCHCFRRLHTSMSVSSKSLETMTCHCMRLSSCTRGWAITRKTLLWGSQATVSMLLRLNTHKALVSTAFGSPRSTHLKMIRTPFSLSLVRDCGFPFNWIISSAISICSPVFVTTCSAASTNTSLENTYGIPGRTWLWSDCKANSSFSLPVKLGLCSLRDTTCNLFRAPLLR